ncbi:TGF-beta-activated kinase 1 and MAP3K7-binding protein 2 isoform X2 [Onthophagus taurus]|uniref:TGF-beta-activated kinase 1 and MAP3K7-binding protein 2 isoform X2 n=1 Tax=Onthophagus taurus TaxID=166361 RepID=UPI0039BE5E81
MFGGVGRKSSNVRAMQLFHELKQQFPTLPDHVVSTCIASHSSKINKKVLIESLEDALAQQELMGRIQPPQDIDLPSPTTEITSHHQTQDFPGENLNLKITTESLQGGPFNRLIKNQNEIMSGVKYNKKNESVEAECGSELNVGNSSFYVKRPNTLNLNTSKQSQERFNNIQPSGKCSDVHKLLNSELVNKPPRSPQSNKRFTNVKNSPTKTSPTKSPIIEKKETADTPTQTTDTLLGLQKNVSPNMNVSLNVNCSMDVQTPTNKTKCTTSLQVVPQQPWCQEVTSPRSFTSVNLTLRPPSSEPQPPIDITSQNSSLTYSTSSFDPQKGLQSKVQITVGPSGGRVSSMRTRPRSSYHPDENNLESILPANRAGSMTDLRNNNNSTENHEEVPIVVKQQIRINNLEVELKTEKCRLIAMQREVASLETNQPNTLTKNQEKSQVQQLEEEVKELQEACKKLTQEIDRHTEQETIPPVERRPPPPPLSYQDQRGGTPLGLGFPTEQVTTPQQHPPYVLQHQQSFGNDGPKWSCHMCTFQNHPLLDRCEQCDMPRILHVSAAPGDNIHIHVTPRISRRKNLSGFFVVELTNFPHNLNLFYLTYHNYLT